MKVPCFRCDTTTELDVNFEVISFACPNCVAVYNNSNRAGLKWSRNLERYDFADKLEIGQQGVFNNQTYTVTGILIKEHEGFDWAEYSLQGTEPDSYIYLSEADGHWIILEEIEFDQMVGNHPSTIKHEDTTFDLYEYNYPKLVPTKGCFDYEILQKSQLIEYINPPLLLSIEKTGKVETTFLGKHIAKSTIKKAFELSTLPTKRGTGLVQPFLFNIGNLAITFCVVALMMLVTSWYLNKDQLENKVLDTRLVINQLNNKEFTSPSFELKGSAAPMSISLYSPVSNSWASVQLALINETTGDEVYANKDIEYYSGYTDGESWTEGSNSEKFNLCGVPAGKYHFVITPSKAMEDLYTEYIDVKATWRAPSNWNVWFISILMAVITIGLYYLEKNFEIKRWSDSRFSPYDTD